MQIEMFFLNGKELEFWPHDVYLFGDRDRNLARVNRWPTEGAKYQRERDAAQLKAIEKEKARLKSAPKPILAKKLEESDWKEYASIGNAASELRVSRAAVAR